MLRELSNEPADVMDERRARALWKLGSALYRLHRFSDAIGPLKEAEHSASLVPGWENIWAGSRCLRAGALLGLERWAEVADLTEDLVDVEDWPYEPAYMQTGLHTRVVALKALGRWQEADATASALRESLRVEQTPRTRAHLREALEIQAWAARRAGNPESGLPLVDEAISLAYEDEDREPLWRALVLRAELLYDAGRSAEARETLQTIIDTFKNGPEEFITEAVISARILKLVLRIRPLAALCTRTLKLLSRLRPRGRKAT